MLYIVEGNQFWWIQSNAILCKQQLILIYPAKSYLLYMAASFAKMLLNAIYFIK